MEALKNSDSQETLTVSQKSDDAFLFEESMDHVYAGFFIRFAALIVDSMVFLSLYYASIFLIAKIFLGTTGQSLIEKQGSLIHILNYLIYSLYFTGSTYLKGYTFGKFIFKLEVIHAEPEKSRSLFQVFIREFFGKWISALIIYMGFILAFFSGKNKHRTLHDYIANTLVIKRNN